MYKFLLTLCSCMLLGSFTAQPSHIEVNDRVTFLRSLSKKKPLYKLPSIDKREIRRWEKMHPNSHRLSTPLNVRILPDEYGEWMDLPDGSRVWQLQLQGANALALAVFLDKVYLPPGSALYARQGDKDKIWSQLGFEQNSTSQRLMLGFVPGETITLEYYEPAQVIGQGRFEIFRVDYAYRYDEGKLIIPSSEEKSPLDLGFGTSLDCQVNINCSAGDDWREEQRSVCRIIVVLAEGTGYCTGALVNNTSRDAKPYILSAWHCMGTYTPLYDLWRFDFDYAVEGCQNGPTEPDFLSLQGAQARAAIFPTDALLLELLQPIPATFQAYFSGWDKGSDSYTGGYMIHHPSNDVMKIGWDLDQFGPFSGRIDWDNGTTTPRNSHFVVRFDQGGVEPGSSGAPFYSQQDQLLIGQVHGGNPSCDELPNYIGRLKTSWMGEGTPATRLMDWLDPLNLGVDTLHGMAAINTSNTFDLEGMVTNDRDQTIENVQLTLVSSDGVQMTTSDTDGLFELSNLEAGIAYSLEATHNGSARERVSSRDIIAITKHILRIDPFTNPYQYLAADVNNSGTISALDLVKIRKVILTLEPDFEVSTWRFVPASYQFVDPHNPFAEAPYLPAILPVALDSTLIYDIIAIKAGDVKGS